MNKNIRNFCIIAHIDHGKSTLADRFLELTKTVDIREMKPQYLDQLDLERERGITIKMTPVKMICDLEKPFSFDANEEIKNIDFSRENWRGSQRYILNLIDTPGHSDFAYEVSRALAAVEGAVLLVDATQGIQAQTLANFELARKAGLKIIGAINKIDLNPPNLKEVVGEVASLLDCSREEIHLVSAKTGENVWNLLRAIIEKIPPPTIKNTLAEKEGENKEIGQGLVFDSFYDDHKGIVAFIRVFRGKFEVNEELALLAGKTIFKAKEVGCFSPALKPTNFLEAGDIGYIATGIKSPDKLKIGDTIVSLSKLPNKENKKIFDFESDIYRNFVLPGFKEPKPVVFVSLYPREEVKYEDLKSALYRLKLNDSSFVFEPEMSEVLGRGFRCGFLGRLHFEIVTERLKREFGLETTSSFPMVEYRVRQKNNWQIVKSPENFPDNYDEAREPAVKLEILTPKEYLGEVLSLQKYFRLSQITTTNFGKDHIIIKAVLPLADLISDFDDRLKSVSRGYASFSYEIDGELPADLVKLEILVAGEIVPGLTRIVIRKEAENVGRQTVERLKSLLPRQQFAQAIQARAFGRIIAREDIPALRKLLGYFGKTGGDRTRKLKLWEKQKRGKEKLKKMGKVRISPEIFREILKK